MKIYSKEYEKAIGYEVRNILSIEWMRYNMYNVEDIYRCIPFLLFRVSDDTNLDRFIHCIDTYRGKEKWVIYTYPYSKRHVNYVLSIDVNRTIYEKCYKNHMNYSPESILTISDYKEHCEKALDDIPQLLDWIKKEFGSA